ncbi:hypothetical protein EIP86_004206 [Pleurotus ostreatoroseus]|nr:hypothetical protein EIP86_004206 [Pleurotus ostreatoroseus]
MADEKSTKDVESRETSKRSWKVRFARVMRPIPNKDYIARQDELARTLHSLGASAYIAEPGANAAFYANISSSNWGLSERPLLLIVTPFEENGAIKGNISILTPAFEATRARLLPVPSDEEIGYPEWAEDANPYDVAVSAIPALQQKNGTIFVDGGIRQFVADGIQRAAKGSLVTTAPVEVRRLRERKSKAELEIMKCVNERTLRSPMAVALIGYLKRPTIFS